MRMKDWVRMGNETGKNLVRDGWTPLSGKSCPSCELSVPFSAKVCGHCGHDFKAAAVAEREEAAARDAAAFEQAGKAKFISVPIAVIFGLTGGLLALAFVLSWEMGGLGKFLWGAVLVPVIGGIAAMVGYRYSMTIFWVVLIGVALYFVFR